MTRTDYAATQVILLCDMTERYGVQVSPDVWVAGRLRPAVRKRFDKAKRRASMACPHKP